MSLLSVGLEPAQLSEGQFSGDGRGQRQLVVGAGGSLQFQTCGGTVSGFNMRQTEVTSTFFYNTEQFLSGVAEEAGASPSSQQVRVGYTGEQESLTSYNQRFKVNI